MINNIIKKIRNHSYFLGLKYLPGFNRILNIYFHHCWTNQFIPLKLQIEVTNNCNANCFMCPRSKIKRGIGTMAIGTFQKIIDQCKSFEGRGLLFVLHKDGEPLLDPHLFERISYIKSNLKKSKVGFYSNGMLLNEKKALEICNSKLDFITFSVDGASKEVYEKIRRGLNYDIVKKNLDRFFELKKETNCPTEVTMQMVVDDSNKHEIKAYRGLWNNKADRIFIKSMHNFLVQGTSIKGNQLTEKQIEICHQPFVELHIYWDGQIGLCCWDYDNMFPLGNVNDQELIELYNSQQFKFVRKEMIKKKCQFMPCKICSQIYGKDLYKEYEFSEEENK